MFDQMYCISLFWWYPPLQPGFITPGNERLYLLFIDTASVRRKQVCVGWSSSQGHRTKWKPYFKSRMGACGWTKPAVPVSYPEAIDQYLQHFKAEPIRSAILQWFQPAKKYSVCRCYCPTGVIYLPLSLTWWQKLNGKTLESQPM